MPKMLHLVHSCKGCSLRIGDECGQVHERILDLTRVAFFCPLTDYPSTIIAQMDNTIRLLRGAHDVPFTSLLLSYIAAKVGALVDKSGFVAIPLLNGKEVIFSYDGIRNLDLMGGTLTILFQREETEYLLVLHVEPALRARRKHSDEDAWVECELAK